MWRFIDSGASDAYTNMAVDEALLISSKVPALRIYSWKPSAVSVGHFQDIENQIKTESCKKLGIDIVRRITGGTAVLHDKDLTYSFIVPGTCNFLPKDIVQSYKLIAAALVLAFRNLGINAEMKACLENASRTSICFSNPSIYEIVVNGKKISGSAQKREQGAMLQHGSIAIDLDIPKMCSLFCSDNPDKLVKNALNRITSLKRETASEVSYDNLAHEIRKGFEKTFSIRFKKSKLSQQELAIVAEIRPKYFPNA